MRRVRSQFCKVFDSNTQFALACSESGVCLRFSKAVFYDFKQYLLASRFCAEQVQHASQIGLVAVFFAVSLMS